MNRAMLTALIEEFKFLGIRYTLQRFNDTYIIDINGDGDEVVDYTHSYLISQGLDKVTTEYFEGILIREIYQYNDIVIIINY